MPNITSSCLRPLRYLASAVNLGANCGLPIGLKLPTIPGDASSRLHLGFQKAANIRQTSRSLILGHQEPPPHALKSLFPALSAHSASDLLEDQERSEWSNTMVRGSGLQGFLLPSPRLTTYHSPHPLVLTALIRLPHLLLLFNGLAASKIKSLATRPRSRGARSLDRRSSLLHSEKLGRSLTSPTCLSLRVSRRPPVSSD